MYHHPFPLTGASATVTVMTAALLRVMAPTPNWSASVTPHITPLVTTVNAVPQATWISRGVLPRRIVLTPVKVSLTQPSYFLIFT